MLLPFTIRAGTFRKLDRISKALLRYLLAGKRQEQMSKKSLAALSSFARYSSWKEMRDKQP